MWEFAILALGKAAGPLLNKAAERHVERFFGDRLNQLGRLGKKAATVTAMERAWTAQLRERNYVLCLRGPRLYGFVPSEVQRSRPWGAAGPIATTHAPWWSNAPRRTKTVPSEARRSEPWRAAGRIATTHAPC